MHGVPFRTDFFVLLGPLGLEGFKIVKVVSLIFSPRWYQSKFDRFDSPYQSKSKLNNMTCRALEILASSVHAGRKHIVDQRSSPVRFLMSGNRSVT